MMEVLEEKKEAECKDDVNHISSNHLEKLRKNSGRNVHTIVDAIDVECIAI